MNTYKIGKVNIGVVNRKSIIAYILNNLGKKNGYICVSNTRTIYLGNKDDKYSEVFDDSLLTIPDGMPLVWLGKLSGYNSIKRTSGPELMEAFLKNEEKTIKHYLLGDTEDILKKIKDKNNAYYKANIVGYRSPEFCDLNDYDYKSFAEEINKSGADIVWLALGSPKQDFFANKLQKYTDNKIIINVGAAFRFLLGEYKMPPKIIQKIGLTGVFWRFLEKPMLFLKLYPKYFYFIISNAFKIKFKS